MARRKMAWKELRVGILAILSFVILATALVLVSGGRGLFTPKYILRTHLENASGLRRGSLVWLAGVEVGSVDGVRISRSDIPARAVEVIMKIERGYQSSIRGDSKATLGSIGLLGDKYIEVSRGSQSYPAISENGQIDGSSPPDIKKIIQGTNDLMANVGDLVQKITEVTGKINLQGGTLGKLINDPAIFNNLTGTSKDLQGLVTQIKTGEGTIGRLIAEPEIYQDLRNTLLQVDSIVSKVDSGEGTLGRFVNDPALYDRAESTMARLETVIQRIEDGEGFLGRLSKDESLYLRFSESLEKFADVAEKMSRGDGTVTKLLKDPSLYANLDQASAELVKFMHDFRLNPKKYLRIKASLF
jgi:phospholipid/cholesterol/gamma-HCH transport system substrate-binding protein